MSNVDRDRDRAIERLLPEALRAHGATASPDACLDAETAAAWADNALGSHQRAAAEAHAANCVRCQALLAALVRTGPAATPVWFRRRVLSWAIPLTAAAAAVIVWTLVPLRQSVAPAPATSTVAIATPPPAARSLPGDPPAQIAPRTSAKAEAEREARSSARQRDQRAQAFAGSSRAAAAAAAPPVPSVPPAAPAAEPPSAAKAVPAPIPPAIAAESADKVAASAPAAPAPQAARTESRLLARRFDAAAAQTPIVSTNPSHRWLIAANGAVRHSIDAGATWDTQETGVSTTLTAGASPAPSICWLVGPRGIVVRSTDGRSWQLLPFGEKVDLVAIRAADENTATITAADGRTFATTDGGRTWAAR